MKALHTIVAATDFSDESRYAAERAALVAQEQGARLTLLHVLSGSSFKAGRRLFRAPADAKAKLINDARRRLNDLAANLALRTTVEATPSVKIGVVREEILSSARRADLLVLGAHGWSPLRDLLLGTTAERVLLTCSHPVLVAKRAPQGGYAHVLVPVDFSPYSAPALALARRIAPRAHMTILHAFRVPLEGRLRVAGASEDAIQRYCDEEQQHSATRISALIGTLGEDTYRTSAAVEQGDAARVILDAAEARAADLVVLGKRGLSRVEALFLGSVTRHVLTGSTCDVLVVHETNHDSSTGRNAPKRAAGKTSSGRV